MKLSSDKRTLALEIRGPHTAEQLDVLIRKLAALRADMLPGVPASRTELGEQSNDGVLLEKEPSLSMAALRAGGFRLWVRNRGLGWLAYEITDQVAMSIHSLISRSAHKVEGVNLFGQGDGNTH